MPRRRTVLGTASPYRRRHTVLASTFLPYRDPKTRDYLKAFRQAAAQAWQAQARPTSKAKCQEMKAALALAVMLAITACGESEDEIYERGYDEGYNDGQYEVCRELESIAPRLKDQLTGCDGF